MKPKIRIVDKSFSHTPNSSFACGAFDMPPTHFEWHRGEQISDLVVVTESGISELNTLKEKNKVLLIIEPESICPQIYIDIRNPTLYNQFKFVLTHDSSLVKDLPNARLYFFGGCWIKPEDQKVYEKSKNVSIIASAKRQTIGHNLRHFAIERFSNKIEGVYGRGYKVLENKIEGLKDFRYHIAIENQRSDYWVTEKLIDCFATGAVPIYYGTTGVKSIFDERGMLFFNTLEELEQCLVKATPEYYEQCRPYIEENFKRCKYGMIPEDALWNSFFSPEFFS